MKIAFFLDLDYIIVPTKFLQVFFQKASAINVFRLLI